MRKLKVLIGGNAVHSVQLVEVVIDVPVSELIPALVNAFQLPLTDLYGRKLVYELRDVTSGEVISPQYMLAAVGITPAARLALDVCTIEDGGIPQTRTEWPAHGPIPTLQASSTLVDESLSSLPVTSPRLPVDESLSRLPVTSPRLPVDESLSRLPVTSPRLPVDESLTELLMPIAGNRVEESLSELLTPAVRTPVSESLYELSKSAVKKKSRTSRRAVLLAIGALAGMGGLGMSYVAYHKTIEMKLSDLLRKYTTPPIPPTPPTPRVQSQMKPEAPAVTVQSQVKPKPPRTAKQLFVFTHHQSTVRSVAWSASSNVLASGGDGKRVLVWGMDGVVKQGIDHPASVSAIAWSPDGKRLATGSNTQVAFFNAQTGAALARSLDQHTQVVTSLAWSPHGSMYVVSGSADKQAIVWDSNTYRVVTTYKQHTAGINAVAWSANGQIVASSSEGGYVRIWTAATGQMVHGYYQDTSTPLRSLAFSPVGGQLAAGGSDGIVRLWNAPTCGSTGLRCTDTPQRISVSPMAVLALAWSPDGQLLAVGGLDGSFTIWNLAQAQKPLFSTKLHDSVHSLAWSSDGKHLATASGTMVTVWEWM